MSKTLRPDDVIPPDGSSVQGRRFLADAVLLVPNLAKLVTRLLKDPRVPRRAKVTLGLAAAYVVSPIDLIPDKLPVIGLMDDILIVMFALDSLIDRSGSEIVEEHWDGPGDVLSIIRETIGVARSMVPKRIATVIDRISG